jgi:hypothetical protein
MINITRNNRSARHRDVGFSFPRVASGLVAGGLALGARHGVARVAVGLAIALVWGVSSGSGAARAGTLSLVVVSGGQSVRASYVGGPGIDDVRVQFTGGGVRVKDRSGVRAAHGCHAAASGEGVCDVSGFCDPSAAGCAGLQMAMVVSTGGGDDSVRLRKTRDSGSPSIRIRTGEGDDRVDLESPLSGAVEGGGGDDVISGSGRLEGGSGDDRIRSRGSSQIDGGPGDDVITGADSLIYGGPGADRITARPGPVGNRVMGGGGDDRIRGSRGYDFIDGDGSDVLPAEPGSGFDWFDDATVTRHPGNDDLDGGGDKDAVDILDYRTRRDPIVVDLALHRAGASGEHDRVRRLPGVIGGSGDDILIGDGHANALYGGGRDRLSGRGGDDDLFSVGKGQLDGGAGNDDLWGPGPGSRCGVGDDTIEPLGALREPAPVDCEFVDMGAGGRLRAHTVSTTGRAVVLVVDSLNGASPGKWTVRAGWNPRGQLLGTLDHDQPGSQRLEVRVPLNAAGRRYIAAGRERITLHFDGSFNSDSEDGGEDSPSQFVAVLLQSDPP